MSTYAAILVLININIKIPVKSLSFCNFIKTEISAYCWSIENRGRFVKLSLFRVDWKICFINFKFEHFFSHEATNTLWAVTALIIG